MAIVVNRFAVPDVGVGPGPFPSPGWVAGTIASLSRLGLTAGTSADQVVLLGSATGTDPIDASNPNRLGGFAGNEGSKAPILTHASACPFYAVLRYAPSPSEGPPTVGMSFELQGS